MAVKRRTIWMSGEEWSGLQAIAKDRGDTVSGVIRDFWRVASEQRLPEPPYIPPDQPVSDFRFRPAPKPGKVNRGEK